MIESPIREKDFYTERVFKIARIYKKETKNPGLRIICTDKESCISILNKTDDEWLNYSSIYIICSLANKEIEKILKTNNRVEIISLKKIDKRHHEIFDHFWQGTAIYLKKPAVFLIPGEEWIDRKFKPIISSEYHNKPNIILGSSNIENSVYSKIYKALSNKHEICIRCERIPNKDVDEISDYKNHYKLNKFKIIEDMVLKNAFPKTIKEKSDSYNHLSDEYLPITNFHSLEDSKAWYEGEKSVRDKIKLLPIYEGFYSTEVDKYEKALLKHGVIMLGGFNCGSDHIARYLLNELAKKDETDLLQIDQLTCESAIKFVGNSCESGENFFGRAFILRNFFDPIIKVREFTREGMIYKSDRNIKTCFTDHTLYEIAKNKIFEHNDEAISKFLFKFTQSPKEMGNFLIITTQYDNIDDLKNAILHHFKRCKHKEICNNMIIFMNKFSNISNDGFPNFYSLANNNYYQHRIKIALAVMIKQFEQWFNKNINIERLLKGTVEECTFTKHANINNVFRPVLFYYMMNYILSAYVNTNNDLNDIETANICNKFQENTQKAYNELYSSKTNNHHDSFIEFFKGYFLHK